MPDSSNNAVGAYIGSDPYAVFSTALKWIVETQKIMPNVSQDIREEAYNIDPFLKGVIVPFLKNYLLSGYSIVTKDNKTFEKAISDIEDWIESIDLLDVFRADFVDFYVTKGHAYRRIGRDLDGGIEALDPLDSSQVKEYPDPWRHKIKAYHQFVTVNSNWSTSEDNITHNCWWIPNVAPGKQWISRDSAPNGVQDEGVKEEFDKLAKDYNITDKTCLRIGSSDDIFAMDCVRVNDPAPIDGVVLAIWLKRLILVNSPNTIFRVLSPILQLKKGVLVEGTDSLGNKILISSVPPTPPAEMETTDPDRYNEMMAEVSAYNVALKKGMNTVISCLKDGGVYGSAPDEELKVIESGREISYDFIKELISLLNEEIGQNFGFPYALISATGSELASSRTILSTLNNAQSGARGYFERRADDLIKEHFKDVKWNGVGIRDMGVRFKLDVPDTTDLLAEAQTKLALSDMLLKLKQLGLSSDDMKAIIDEQTDLGELDLSEYSRQDVQAVEPTIMKSSKVDLEPSEISKEDIPLAKDLLKAFKDAGEVMKKGITEAMGEP